MARYNRMNPEIRNLHTRLLWNDNDNSLCPHNKTFLLTTHFHISSLSKVTISLAEFTTRLSIFIEEKVKKSKSALSIHSLRRKKKRRKRIKMKNPQKILLPPFSIGRGNGEISSSDAWPIDGSNLKVVPCWTLHLSWLVPGIATRNLHAYLSTEAR